MVSPGDGAAGGERGTGRGEGWLGPEGGSAVVDVAEHEASKRSASRGGCHSESLP